MINQTNIDFNDAATAHQVEPEYDRIVELYFEDMESFEKAMARPEIAACLEDHPNFMNVKTEKSLVTIEVSETVVLDKNG